VIPQFAKQRKQQNNASNGWQFSLLRFGLSASNCPPGTSVLIHGSAI